MQGQGETIITEDVEIVGTIKAANGLRIEGRLNGDLNCAGDVVIGKTGSIKGNVSVNGATVHGQVTGNIIAKDRIELKATARISGDIKGKRLTVEDGVSFVGKAEVNPSGMSGRPVPEAAAKVADEAGEDVSEGEPSEDGKKGLFGKK
jgi:cytoskeletal protein CcmA (bactofilin family)